MKQKTRRRLQNIGVIVLIVAGLAWVIAKFYGYTSSTFTDNAQVHQLLVPVNSRVQGFVKEVRFNDYTQVKKGDTLVIIDDAEFRLRLAQAKADLQNALVGKDVTSSGVSVINSNISVTDASLHEIEVLMENARRDLDRYTALLKKDAVTRQQYDAVETNYKSLAAKYDTMRRQRKATSVASGQQSQRIGQSDALIELAKTSIDIAELNLSYTVITAPCDGYTSKLTIQPGQLIQPGQQLLSIVDTSDVWVIANYKERQIKRMEIGDKVNITVDAIPDVTFHGTITNLSQATGTHYQPMSHDNAVGNFIKVEQRIPVKIRFDKDNDASDMARLRSGMNVECKVLE